MFEEGDCRESGSPFLTFIAGHSIVFPLNTTNKDFDVWEERFMDNAALGVLTEKLVQFGLTRQEATIYMCLLRSKDLSGYEVSKLTGISRSNVYSALAALVDEGRHIC